MSKKDEEKNNKTDEEKNEFMNENSDEIKEGMETPVNQDDALVNKINELLEKNEKLENEVKDMKNTYLRKAADFENYKKRTEAEQYNYLKYGAEAILVEILPVYDDLKRSLAHVSEKSNVDALVTGLKLVLDKFTKILDDQGVKKIEASGKPFDVHYHEALMQQPVEGVPPHTVIEEIEPGYMYKDKVIRHTKVIVSQELADSSGEANDNSNGAGE
ncbi:MAG: nucleotide exchange factor GrpE [bacterium]